MGTGALLVRRLSPTGDDFSGAACLDCLISHIWHWKHLNGRVLCPILQSRVPVGNLSPPIQLLQAGQISNGAYIIKGSTIGFSVRLEPRDHYHGCFLMPGRLYPYHSLGGHSVILDKNLQGIVTRHLSSQR